MTYGVYTFLTDQGIGPAALARQLEARGFDSLWVTEHIDAPASDRTPAPEGGAPAEKHYRLLDPFLAFTAAATVTQRLLLGTGVALVAQRDPIITAKEVATLDLVSHGRFLFGIGIGWNREETDSHATKDAGRIHRQRRGTGRPGIADPRRVRHRLQTRRVRRSGQGFAVMTRMAAALAAVVAAAVALGGCSPADTSALAHRESLASVEFDDQPVGLPTTRMVICRRAAGEQTVFFWTGSNMLMPRRPMEERRSDSVEVRFDDDPLTVTAVNFQFLRQGEQVSAQWSTASGAAESVTLALEGAGHYLLTATVPQPAPPHVRLVFVRIEFDC